MLQYVVVCCSVTKCVAVCCSTHLRLPIRGNEALCLSDIVLQCVAVSCCSTLQYRVAVCCSIVLQYVAVSCCSTLQYLVLYCSILQHVAHVAVCCSVLQCVAACCSVLQCVAAHTSFSFSSSKALRRCFSLTLRFSTCRITARRSRAGTSFSPVSLPVRETQRHTQNRERERKREIRIYVYIHIYIYILFSTCRITARQSRAVCCSVLLCVAVCCSALQCVVVCRSMLQCVAVCCSNGGEPVDPTTIELTASLRCRVVQCVAA